MAQVNPDARFEYITSGFCNMLLETLDGLKAAYKELDKIYHSGRIDNRQRAEYVEFEIQQLRHKLDNWHNRFYHGEEN